MRTEVYHRDIIDELNVFIYQRLEVGCVHLIVIYWWEMLPCLYVWYTGSMLQNK